MASDTSIRYQRLSIHFDRINILNCFERNPARNTPKQYNSIPIPKDLTLFSNIPNAIVKPVVKKIKFTTDDKMSTHSKNKLSKSIRYLNFIALDKKVELQHSSKVFKFKIAFITLTLSSPQVHTDNELKRHLLNQLFVELKNKYKVENYVWRAEKQTLGNVHFHILVDRFIPHQELLLLWNRLQNKLGYVDRYTERMSSMSYKVYKETFKHSKRYTDDMIRKAWIKGKSNGWKFPNSTDIHSLQFIKDIDSYLCKYMVKDDQTKDIIGRLWGCSHSLSNITGGVTLVDTGISAELTKLYESGHAHFYSGKYFTIAFEDIMFLRYLGCNQIFELYREFLINHFNIVGYG